MSFLQNELFIFWFIIIHAIEGAIFNVWFIINNVKKSLKEQEADVLNQDCVEGVK